MTRFSGNRFKAMLVSLFCILVFAMPLHAFDWVRDFDAGLEEALERGSPVFIFLCQDT